MDLLNRLYELFELRRHERRAVRELKALSPRSLADIGVEPDDITVVARVAARRAVAQNRPTDARIPALGQSSLA